MLCCDVLCCAIISSYILEPSCSTAKFELKVIRGNQNGFDVRACAIDYLHW